MATDIPAFRAGLVEERAAVQALFDLVDVQAEKTRYENAEATFLAAQQQFGKASRRWDLLHDKQQRLIELDRQIELLTP